MSKHTRRSVLRSAAGLAALGPVATEAASGKIFRANNLPAIPRTPEEIRAAFADVRYQEDPSDFDRRLARARYPDVAVPDEGAIPDPQDHIEIELQPPAWALATAYDVARNAKEHGAEPDRRLVDDHLLDQWNAWETWVLPDGRDAPAAILAAVEEDHG